MSPNANPPPRLRRGFSSLALLSAAALLFSSTSAALLALSTGTKTALAQLARRPGEFTHAPTRAFLGLHPGRDPQGRGGMWTADRRRQLTQATDHDRLVAMVGEPMAFQRPHTRSVAPEPGASHPWEGSAPTGDGAVNTGNGDKLTALHLMGWRVRGGMALDFTLYHNSQTNYSDELGAGWTWTYDVYINNLTTNPVLHWGDGTSVPYTAPGGGGGGGGGTGSGNEADASDSMSLGTGLREAGAQSGPSLRDSATGEEDPFADEDPLEPLFTATTYAAPAGIHETLVQNADATWTATKKDGTVYAFNAAGFLTKVTDRSGNAITLTLNSGNYVTKITDPTGRYVNVSVNASNKFTGITDMAGRTWSFALNGSGDLSSVTWPDLGDGHTYADAFAYNTTHQIATHTDRRGKAWTYAYNSDGSLASETDPLGHATTYGYTASATTVTDPLGHAGTDNYGSGVQASHVDESGYSVSYTARNANYDVTSTTDARGKVWTATYDSMGNVLTSTDPLGHAKTFTYNGLSEPLTSQDALNHTTTSTYDMNGNLLTVVNALGKTVVTNTMGAYGLVASSANALVKSTSFSYDANGDPTVVTDPTGVATTVGYDALSRPISVKDGLANETDTSYDAWDRPVSVAYPAIGGVSATETTSYLATGQTLAVIDELGHTTTNAYDDAGRMTSVTNGRGDGELYGYDAADRRTTVTNGRGKVRTYAFTARGDVSSLTMPDGAVESWSYDGAGHTTAYVNPLSQTILYGFDDAGRETLVDYPTGTDTTFGYDAADRRTSMADATGATAWAYDGANRETTFTSPQGSQTSGYDDAGHRTGLTGTGIARAWTYDDAGRPLTLANESSETTAYAYDGAGRLSATTLANGQVTTEGYDARSRQTSVLHKASATGATISSESYVYDKANNLSSKTVDGTTTTYGYDAADQLTGESRLGYAASYAYDANGNRTSKTLNGVTDTYAIDDGDKLTAVTEGATTVKSYTYDAAGRTRTVASSAGTTTLSYDYEGRVTSIAYPGGGSNSFSYNGLDTRVGKVDGAGTATYRRDGAEVTAPVLGDGVAVYTPGVSQRRSGATAYDLHDRLGTAARQTNSSTATTATRTYDAFGMLVASTGTPQGPFGFAGNKGYQEDGDSGLKLLGHRYYDPSTGRFLTRDPAKDGRNWYGYCANMPTKAYDDDGQKIRWTIEPGSEMLALEIWLAIRRVGQTKTGSRLVNMLNDPSTDYEIVVNQESPFPSSYDPEHRRFRFSLVDTENYQYSDTDGNYHDYTIQRVVSHELGHLVDNSESPGTDDGGEQETVDRWENPISRELGDPITRGKYPNINQTPRRPYYGPPPGLR